MMKSDDVKAEKARQEYLEAKVALSRAKTNGDPGEIARLEAVVNAKNVEWRRAASVPS